jgi:hypothetical protein
VARPSRQATASTGRDRLKQDFARAASLRELYPQLAEVRVEFEFQDGTTRTPSPQSFSYFPAARGFFRYACPCHSCSGEFDLSPYIAELADKTGRKQRARSISVPCTGVRAHQPFTPAECPICARIHLSATLHSTE